ncbi:MAG: paraquat-inducible protein A [Saccharospirillaceae bacterium]|nr:paraquat-inducible protein A [Pseudomonadales bacterium]NRB80855.1 paraquat-inducible protein A [Saccharospirillaceae bacterium]
MRFLLKWQAQITLFLTLASVSLLMVALTQPFIRITKLIVFDQDTSLAQGFVELFKDGEWLILIILFVMTIVLPLCKIITYGMLSFATVALQSKLLKLLTILSKWAMLDVFVVAILVVAVKLGALAQVTVLPGFYWFVATLACSYLLAYWVQFNRKQNDARS